MKHELVENPDVEFTTLIIVGLFLAVFFLLPVLSIYWLAFGIFGQTLLLIAQKIVAIMFAVIFFLGIKTLFRLGE